LASILAAFTVGIGILLELPKYSTSLHNLATWLVLGGIAIESLCTVLLFVFDERISAKQDSIIISQQSRILALQQQTSNRALSADDSRQLSTQLGRFSGQPAKIVVFPVNFESVWIADQVYGILLNAHWKVEFPERSTTPPADGFMVQGIWVDRSNDNASAEAANALREALNSHVSMASGSGGAAGVSHAFDPAKSLVWILVGDKPSPLRTWIAP
jgi:hypothetical protein